MGLENKRKKLIQFGAGNIGRSFIGQLFACNGWEVVFIDINQVIVDELNKKKSYKVYVKSSNRKDEIIEVPNVRAVDGRDMSAVVTELVNAEMICTSVGAGVLSNLLPIIARALVLRECAVDIILAENIRKGADYIRAELKPLLPLNYNFEKHVGLVETSIGKMVPIMKESDRMEDPLAVFAEEYNTLIVDRHAFKGSIPSFSDLKSVENIAAYVDRKLFIHNLGHAAAAYLGYDYNHNIQYIWEALEIPSVYRLVRTVMMEAAEALVLEYPDTLKTEELMVHIDDLLYRFANKSLGDTVFRVGKDLFRKLDTNDRIVGAMRMALKHSVQFKSIETVYKAACSFGACDENGKIFENDRLFHEKYHKYTYLEVLEEFSRFP